MTDRAPGRSARRRARYAARAFLWQESSLPRVRACGRNVQGTQTIKTPAAAGSVVSRVVGREPAITLRVEDTRDGARGTWSGVQSCGSVWACPVCSESVQAERAQEVAAALVEARRRGWVTAFVTLTVRHQAGVPLAAVWGAVSAGWRAATSGSRSEWAQDRADYGVAGYLRLTEVTHGRNGWHVHVHALVMLDPAQAQLVPEGALHLRHAEALGGRMLDRWTRAVRRHGAFTPSRRHGLDVRLVVDDVDLAAYFAKNVYSVKSPTSAAFDVTSSAGKTARAGNVTPFGLLEGAQAGDADALDRWREWERVSRGRRQLLWSNGLRGLLGLVDEVDDVDLVNAPRPGRDVLAVTPQAFRVIARRRGLLVELLDAAERDDGGHLLRFLLLHHGIAWQWCDPPGRQVSRWARPA